MCIKYSSLTTWLFRIIQILVLKDCYPVYLINYQQLMKGELQDLKRVGYILWPIRMHKLLLDLVQTHGTLILLHTILTTPGTFEDALVNRELPLRQMREVIFHLFMGLMLHQHAYWSFLSISPEETSLFISSITFLPGQKVRINLPSSARCSIKTR